LKKENRGGKAKRRGKGREGGSRGPLSSHPALQWKVVGLLQVLNHAHGTNKPDRLWSREQQNALQVCPFPLAQFFR
jgi:hypothetical protein